jgi:hypothetical protein
MTTGPDTSAEKTILDYLAEQDLRAWKRHRGVTRDSRSNTWMAAAMLMLAVELDKTNERLDRLSAIAAGEQRTASDTTPTCGSTGESDDLVTPEMIDAGLVAWDEQAFLTKNLRAVYRAMLNAHLVRIKAAEVVKSRMRMFSSYRDNG